MTHSVAHANMRGKIAQAIQTVERTIQTAHGEFDTLRVGLGAKTATPDFISRHLDAATRAASQVKATIEVARQEAKFRRSQSRKVYMDGPDGSRYFTALSGLGGLIPAMTPEQVAARLDECLDDGRTAEARAILDLASAHFPRPTAVLFQTIRQAEDKVRTADERAAVAELADVSAVEFRWKYAEHRLRETLLDVTTHGKVPNEAGYSAAYILGDDPSPNAATTVRSLGG